VPLRRIASATAMRIRIADGRSEGWRLEMNSASAMAALLS
jgi:hypothetical protein